MDDLTSMPLVPTDATSSILQGICLCATQQLPQPFFCLCLAASTYQSAYGGPAPPSQGVASQAPTLDTTAFPGGTPRVTRL